MEYSVRPASEDDLEQVALLESRSLRPPWSIDAFRAELDKPHHNFWVVTDDETDSKVYAYAVFSFPAEQAHLQTFAVQPNMKRKGMGTYLLRQIINFVMRKKGESIVLEVRKGNSPAISLYQKLGFTVIHSMKGFYPDGEDGYSMIYKTERNRLTGDPDVDFDEEDHGQKNLN